MKTAIIHEAEFAEKFEKEVVPYLYKTRKEGYFERVPGQRIRYERFRTDEASPRGEVVIFHGYTEGITKFYEVAYYFLKEGFHVSLMEHRGHGRSYKEHSAPLSIDIPDYTAMLKDMHHFVHEIVMASLRERGETELPLMVYGHSMGGGLTARYLEEYPDDFDKAVLNSPMLELMGSGLPNGLVSVIAKLSIALGKGGAFIPGSAPFDGKEDLEGSCTDCQSRYHWYNEYQKANPDYQPNMTTWRTALSFYKLTRDVVKPEKMARVKTPVLLFQSGKDNMVAPGGQNTFVAAIPQGKLIRLEDAKHESYRCRDEILDAYYPALFEFMEG